MHAGDEGYGDELRRRFPAAESDASERLIELKRKLREDQDGNFWRILLEGLTSVIGSQFAFVAKRILVNDEGSAVEMPPYGTPGSCLMVEAFYYDDGFDTRDFVEKSMAQAYGAPCGHMRHDKVFLIPERFNDFITSNPNQLPFPADAYLAVPLFADGKCFAHFGVLWSPLGLRKRSLSWGYIEMILHALEDLVLQRLLDGDCFWKRGQQNAARSGKVIPHDVVLASQSVKIRARNLSHEMRTPMQGVVGMLDVMQATVQESMESQTNPQVKQIFQTLKHGIEVIQGWSSFSCMQTEAEKVQTAPEGQPRRRITSFRRMTSTWTLPIHQSPRSRAMMKRSMAMPMKRGSVSPRSTSEHPALLAGNDAGVIRKDWRMHQRQSIERLKHSQPHGGGRNMLLASSHPLEMSATSRPPRERTGARHM